MIARHVMIHIMTISCMCFIFVFHALFDCLKCVRNGENGTFTKYVVDVDVLLYFFAAAVVVVVAVVVFSR